MAEDTNLWSKFVVLALSHEQSPKMDNDFPLFLKNISPREVHDRPPGAGQCTVAGCLGAVPAGVIHVFLFAVKLENNPRLGPGEVHPIVATLARNRVLRHGG